MNGGITATPIRTGIFKQGDDLDEFIWSHAGTQLRERTVLALTSKIISIAEKALVPKSALTKRALIERESEAFLCETAFGVSLTIKHGLLIPSAGIDESNSESGDYILYPADPYASAKRIHAALKKRSGLKEFGLIITDSHTTPLRKGVTGVALSHWGFRATRSCVGEDDLFGRKLRMTSVNMLDALAVTAVLVMGESAECQPLAVIEHGGVEFTDSSSAAEIQIPLEEDLYGPLLKG